MKKSHVISISHGFFIFGILTCRIKYSGYDNVLYVGYKGKEVDMPTISMFFGIVVSLYFMVKKPPGKSLQKTDRKSRSRC